MEKAVTTLSYAFRLVRKAASCAATIAGAIESCVGKLKALTIAERKND
jgi:hypothetical protein